MTLDPNAAEARLQQVQAHLLEPANELALAALDEASHLPLTSEQRARMALLTIEAKGAADYSTLPIERLLPADRSYAQAMRAETLPEARKLLNQALSDDPSHFQSLTQYGLVLLLSHDWRRFAAHASDFGRRFSHLPQSDLLDALATLALGESLDSEPAADSPIAQAVQNLRSARLRFQLGREPGFLQKLKLWGASAKLFSEATQANAIHPAIAATLRDLKDVFPVSNGFNPRQDDPTRLLLARCRKRLPDGMLDLIHASISPVDNANRASRINSLREFIQGMLDSSRAPSVFDLAFTPDDARERWVITMVLNYMNGPYRLLRDSERPDVEALLRDTIVRGQRLASKTDSETEFLWGKASDYGFHDLAFTTTVAWCDASPESAAAWLCRAYSQYRQRNFSRAESLTENVDALGGSRNQTTQARQLREASSSAARSGTEVVDPLWRAR